jgi:glutamate carboxypeptidase
MTPDALRDLLTSWANLNSGSDNVPGLDRMRTALRQEFASLPGAASDEIPLTGTTAQILHVRMRPDAPRRVLLSGHYDTVYGATHPFQTCTRLNADTLRGPGVADMKGGLVVMLTALRELAQSPHAAHLGYDVLLTPDEETGSVASRAVLESTVRARLHAFALVFEPARANGNLVKSRKGTGIFTIACHGRAAHAGRDPAAGRNAILALAELLPKIDALNRELPGVMLNVGSMRGGGAVNIVPDLAVAEVNIRITHLADETRVLERLRALIAPLNALEGYRVELTGRFNRPPKEVTPVEEKLFSAWQRCARDLGVTLDWEHVAGGSDGNLFSAAGLPNLDGLGPVGDHLHSPEEFVHLPSLAQRAAIAARFLQGVASSEIGIPS